MNIPKVWGFVTAGASPTLQAGFNVASVSCGGGEITVNIQSDMASSSYAVWLSFNEFSTGLGLVADDRAAGSFNIVGFATSTGATVNLCSVADEISFLVFGAQ